MTRKTDLVKVERRDAVCEVIINRPEARNAVNLELCHALFDVFSGFNMGEDIRAVLLRSEGTVFCAGADLKERDGRDEAWVIARRQAAFKAYMSIETCPLPVVCAVHGHVVGSGGEIAMASDFIVASDKATFLFPEPQWGTVGATQRLQRVIGVSSAKELLFTGRKLGVAEAYARGLVARILPADGFLEQAREIAAKVAQAPHLAMQLTKQAVDHGSRTDLASGIEIELSAIRQVLSQSNWRAGVERFNSEVGNG
ncbi:enoyl-CoA hydratase/isomerase family protein [Sulfitobacter sp. NFXS29]|uniref:enoyl-CoA hydratase/isomerase family protein n=1 Tax=Sulfitobacter sp. NFXS29 TaxID=2818438 RepID=UPI0032E03D82